MANKSQEVIQQTTYNLQKNSNEDTIEETNKYFATPKQNQHSKAIEVDRKLSKDQTPLSNISPKQK